MKAAMELLKAAMELTKAAMELMKVALELKMKASVEMNEEAKEGRKQEWN
jgi:hypothetical protein